MNDQTSQIFESFVPVYDAVPEKWEDAREFLVEHLKKISNAVNIREIGWFLDEELLSGKQFVPSDATAIVQGTNPQARSVLRIVVDCGPLAPGLNTIAHGILFDSNFTLIDLWATGTNSTTLVATIFGNSDTISLTATDILITSNGAYDRAWAFLEYIQEI